MQSGPEGFLSRGESRSDFLWNKKYCKCSFFVRLPERKRLGDGDYNAPGGLLRVGA